MKYPAMGRNPRNAVSVPALNGGVNFNDALNLVDDNQMTDCKNVWYKDGVLQTRPKIFTNSMSFSADYPYKKTIYNTVEVNNKKCKCSVFYDSDGLELIFSAEDSTEYIAWTSEGTITSDIKAIAVYNGKPTVGVGVYVLVTDNNNYVKLYELVSEGDRGYIITPLGANDIYSPAVYINGKMNSYSEIAASQDVEYAAASYFEGHSAISEAWEDYYYVTDGKSASLTLPRSFVNCTIKIEYTSPWTGIVYSTPEFDFPANEKGFATDLDKAGPYWGDKMYVSTNSGLNMIQFDIKNPDYKEGAEQNPEYIGYAFGNSLGLLANNLRVRVKEFAPKPSILAGATIGTSFGGNADGIYGGTRIFLSGISTGENRNLLAWSDLNNPTYFSENTNVNVGDTKKITALAKQDDMLVIFKGNELHYSVYSAGVSYTAEDVIKGRVLDVTTLGATFPIVQISDTVGCDLPYSIQLCGNRLIWATSDNKVYMLRSANQYSTVNVTPISQMIEGNLPLLPDGSSCTFDGHYFLKSGNRIYLLNYDYYYFHALPSYSDNKKAQRKMIWYVWEVPSIKNEAFSFLHSDGSLLFIFAGQQRTNGIATYSQYFLPQTAATLPMHVGEDYVSATEIYPIESVIQTKMFDFGAMDRFKSIEQIYMGFGETGGEISLEYVTERGTHCHGQFELVGEANEKSPQYIKTKRFLPGIRRALRFGIRLTCKGNIAVDGILIKYKYMGVTR